LDACYRGATFDIDTAASINDRIAVMGGSGGSELKARSAATNRTIFCAAAP
jgi:hypothetical protein